MLAADFHQLNNNQEGPQSNYDNWVRIVLLVSNLNTSPTYQNAMSGPPSEVAKWNEAISKEYSSLKANNVFSQPLRLPPGLKALDTTMVLKIKEMESTDEKPRYKARLCAKGFRQQYGIDFHETSYFSTNKLDI